MITRELKIVPCDVIKNVPYIRDQSLCCDSVEDRSEVGRLTGVRILRNRVTLAMPDDVTVAAAGVGHEDDVGASF